MVIGKIKRVRYLTDLTAQLSPNGIIQTVDDVLRLETKKKKSNSEE